jgi:hypothetical protein
MTLRGHCPNGVEGDSPLEREGYLARDTGALPPIPPRGCQSQEAGDLYKPMALRRRRESFKTDGFNIVGFLERCH